MAFNILEARKSWHELPWGNISTYATLEQEDDGQWIAEVVDLSAVLAYGQTRQEAITRAQALALRVLADRLDHGEQVPEKGDVFSVLA